MNHEMVEYKYCGTTNKVSVCRYDSAAELTEEITFKRSDNINKWKRVENELNASRYYNKYTMDHWLGFPTYQKLKEAVRHGWPEAVAKTQHIQLTNMPTIKGVVRRKKRSDFGDELDMQSVYSGDLDRAWTTFEHTVSENIGTNNITIVVNMSTNHTVHAAKAFWKGAAASILCDAITKMGKAVEIVAIMASTRANRGSVPNQIELIQVKDFYYPMDRENAHAVLSPGFIRGFGFKAIIKGADMADGSVKSNLGVPWEPPEEVMSKLFPNRRVIYVPKNIESAGACETYLQNTTTKLLEAA